MGGLKQTVDAIYLTRGLGECVPRAAQADPQNAWRTIYTIAGGCVLVTSLVGVRTVIQAGGASNMQFRHSIGPTVISLATAITGNAVNTVYSVTGDVNDGIQIGAAGLPITGGMTGGIVATAVRYAMAGMLMFTGNIQVTMTAAAGTGSTRFVLHYIPVDPGASVSVG